MLRTFQRRKKRRGVIVCPSTKRCRSLVEPLEPRQLLAGDGLAANYFNNTGLSGNAALSRVDPAVNFNWGSASPGSGVNVDNFSARWTGQVQAVATGATTFYTSSDDGVRLFVNGVQLINNWTNHSNTTDSGTINLTAGTKYDIRVEFYDAGYDAVAQLSWSAPSIAKQAVPQSALYSTTTTGGGTGGGGVTGTGTGLLGTYFDNADLTNQKLTRTDSTVNFNWASGSPDASVGVDTFSARWTGQIQANYSETYTFTIRSDDGSRLTINGQQIINGWSDHSARDDTGTITLVAGQKYDIVLDYYENTYDATMALSWASASQTKQIVPRQYLYPPAPAVPDTLAPSPPSTLALLGKSDTSVTVKWNAATDNVGVAGYDIYRGTAKVGSVDGSTLSFTELGLSASTAYSYSVVARDAAGNASPASNKLAVTTDAAAPAGNGTGLTAQYFDNIDFTNLKVTRTDATVNFDWGNGSPDPSVGVDTFSARWTGQVQAKYSEAYTFYTFSDDGVRLWVNNMLVINNWNDHGPTENAGQITLAAGQKYSITMEFYENGYGATAKLSWSSASQAKQIVPQQYLYGTSTPAGPTPPAVAGNWNLLFNDDFNTLDTNTWGERYWWNGDKGSDVVFKPGNIAVNNGVLTITAKKETATAWDGSVHNWTSGLLTTGGIKDGAPGGFNFTYGYMEARIKIPPGQGLWPSFWALPANYDDYQGELDAMEIVDARPTIHEMHYHRQGWDTGAQWDRGAPFSDGYHTYALDWEPDHIAWSVDGVEHLRYTSKSSTDIVNQPMYLIMNLDLGGQWAGTPDATTPFPAQMNVDYVRVWQH